MITKIPNRGKSDKATTKLGGRTAARLVGVQALYEMEMAGVGADQVLQEFLTKRWSKGADREDLRAASAISGADTEFLGELVQGVASREAELDALIAPFLSGDWVPERIEVILRAILRAGAYELLAKPDVPPRVVITEYVDVAHAFYDGKEPGFVNAIMDRLAKHLRQAEMAGPEEAHGSQ